MSTFVSCEKVSLCPPSALPPSARMRSSGSLSVCGFSRRRLRKGVTQSARSGEFKTVSKTPSSIAMISGSTKACDSLTRVSRFSS